MYKIYLKHFTLNTLRYYIKFTNRFNLLSYVLKQGNSLIKDAVVQYPHTFNWYHYLEKFRTLENIGILQQNKIRHICVISLYFTIYMYIYVCV